MINRFSTGVFQSRYPQSCGALALSLVALLLLLSACSEEPSVLMKTNQQGGLSASFTPPDMLTQSRAIDQSELDLLVSVVQMDVRKDYPVEITAGSEPSTQSISAARGETLNITVTWSYDYNGQSLILAQAETRATIPVNAGAEYEITISSGDYSTDFDPVFDPDGDGSSNLDELNKNTDPTVMEGPPIVPVTISFVANLPEQLRGVRSEINDSLSAVATVATIDITQEVPLNRVGDTWTGEISWRANTDVQIKYTFYSSIRPGVELANWQNSFSTGENGMNVDLPSSDYEYRIDSDGDGKNNVQEIIAGTNPEDRNSPVPNPCDISNFEVNCNVDTDDDGKPDSVETETADQDGDSIPDYLESRNDDADEDGKNAELDSDETNPCVPDNQAFACNDSGPDDLPPASPLSYEFFTGSFANMPDFSRLTSSGSGTAETFSLPPSNGERFYALQFTGQLYVEQADEYTFYSESDDGSLLYINGRLVVNNDGIHGLVETSGIEVLPAGLHDIKLEYFQNDGSEGLTVSWSSSTMSKQVIPENLLFAP